MTKLLTLFTMLFALSTTPIYANTSACTVHTDAEYNEMIIGKWGTIPSQKFKDGHPIMTFLPNGTLTETFTTCYEEKILATWFINNGKITITVIKSVADYNASSTGTIVCMGPNILKVKWAEYDFQTIYRL